MTKPLRKEWQTRQLVKVRAEQAAELEDYVDGEESPATPRKLELRHLRKLKTPQPRVKFAGPFATCRDRRK